MTKLSEETLPTATSQENDDESLSESRTATLSVAPRRSARLRALRHRRRYEHGGALTQRRRFDSALVDSNPQRAALDALADSYRHAPQRVWQCAASRAIEVNGLLLAAALGEQHQQQQQQYCVIDEYESDTNFDESSSNSSSGDNSSSSSSSSDDKEAEIRRQRHRRVRRRLF